MKQSMLRWIKWIIPEFICHFAQEFPSFPGRSNNQNTFESRGDIDCASILRIESRLRRPCSNYASGIPVLCRTFRLHSQASSPMWRQHSNLQFFMTWRDFEPCILFQIVVDVAESRVLPAHSPTYPRDSTWSRSKSRSWDLEKNRRWKNTSI